MAVLASSQKEVEVETNIGQEKQRGYLKKEDHAVKGKIKLSRFSMDSFKKQLYIVFI